MCVFAQVNEIFTMTLPASKLLTVMVLSILVGCSPQVTNPEAVNSQTTTFQATSSHTPSSHALNSRAPNSRAPNSRAYSSAAILAEKLGVNSVAKPHPKPGAGVNFENTAPYVLQQNVPEDVPLVLLTSATEGAMDVRITVSDDLTLNSKNTARFELVPNGRYELPVNVTAHQTGRHYINLQVLTTVNKRQASRALAAVVQVGDELQFQKNQGATPSSAAGDGVVVMPAQETIIP